MSKKYDVIVTGGRGYEDYDKVANALKLFDIGMIIQGGAAGADQHARRYAELADIECRTYEADWKKYGKAAGPMRNKLMLEENPNAVVLGFPGGRGTADCLKRAVALSRTILLVR